MQQVIMKGYKVSELRFVSKLENGTRVELGNRYSYAQNNMCRGEFTLDVEDKQNPEKFGIHLVLIGVFEFNADLEKERVHVLSFKDLFPYARTIITTVTSNAGIPPVIIPPIDIESQDIYRFEKNS